MTSETVAVWRGIAGRLRERREDVLASMQAAKPAAKDLVGMALHDDGLTKLLDEREALLEAAKYLVENYPERQATRYMGALKEAIAKAES